MAFSIIPKELWKGFCETVGKYSQGNLIEIEVASLDVGDQIEETWIQFTGLSYDKSKELIHVNTLNDEHMISRPRSIVIDEDGPNIKSITIKDTNSQLHIILFRRPLMLPSPVRSQAEMQD